MALVLSIESPICWEKGTRTTTRTWAGLLPICERVWHFSYAKRLRPFRRKITCPTCAGKRLNDVALAVRFRDLSIHDLTQMSIGEAAELFSSMQLNPESS